MLVAAKLETGELGPVVTHLHNVDGRYETQSMEFADDCAARSYWADLVKAPHTVYDDGAFWFLGVPAQVTLNLAADYGALTLYHEEGNPDSALGLVAEPSGVIGVLLPLLAHFGPTLTALL